MVTSVFHFNIKISIHNIRICALAVNVGIAKRLLIRYFLLRDFMLTRFDLTQYTLCVHSQLIQYTLCVHMGSHIVSIVLTQYRCTYSEYLSICHHLFLIIWWINEFSKLTR